MNSSTINMTHTEDNAHFRMAFDGQVWSRGNLSLALLHKGHDAAPLMVCAPGHQNQGNEKVCWWKCCSIITIASNML